MKHYNFFSHKDLFSRKHITLFLNSSKKNVSPMWPYHSVMLFCFLQWRSVCFPRLLSEYCLLSKHSCQCCAASWLKATRHTQQFERILCLMPVLARAVCSSMWLFVYVCVSVCWCEEQSSLSCAHRLQSTVNDEDCIKTRPSVSHVRAAKTLTPCKGRKAAATMQVNQPSGFAHSKSLNFEWNEPPSTLLFFS